MDLARSDTQRLVMEEARRFLSSELSRARRAAWDKEPTGCDAKFWRAVAELGWFGYGLPEQYGGQGASLLDVGLLMEECGRAAVPMAIFSAVTGALALNALGTAAQKKAWLPAVARGEKLVTLAVAEKSAVTNPAAFVTTVQQRKGALRLSGEKRYVLQGGNAHAFLVAARDEQGVSLVLVPSEVSGVHILPLETFGKDRQSIVRFDEVTLPTTAIASAPGKAWPKLEQLRARFATLLCADMVGGGDAVLDMTCAYVAEREQFGVKIGTFQAVQQMAAVMAIELEGARGVTHQALWRLAHGKPADREVAIAKAWTGHTYVNLTLTAHQLHGGAGYVLEHELHRYSARAAAAELLFGSSEEWLVALADGLKLVR